MIITQIFSFVFILFVICAPLRANADVWPGEIDRNIKEKTEEQIKNETKRIKIVGFGDSLMSGYKLDNFRDFPATMERELWKRNYKNFKMYREGVSGETTTEALKRLDAIIKLEPDIVMLEFGINDVLQKVSMRTIFDNLTTMITKLNQNKIMVLLIGMKAPPTPEYKDYTKFAAMYKYLAKKHRISLYPFFLEGVAGNPKLTLADGVHPNLQGVELMVQNIIPYIEKMIELEMQSDD